MYLFIEKYLFRLKLVEKYRKENPKSIFGNPGRFQVQYNQKADVKFSPVFNFPYK